MTPEQSAVVSARGHLVVVATAGSGKTHTLTARTCQLVQENHSCNVLNVSFTQVAAREMRSRVATRLGDSARRVATATFHRVCIDGLKRHGMLPESIVPNARAKALQAAVLAKAFTQRPSWYESDDNHTFEAWVRGAYTAELDGLPGERAQFALTEYRAMLSRENLIDLADIQLRYVQLLRADVVKPMNVAFLQVDEFQDTDAIQLAFVIEMAKRGCEVMVVGDDDQSLFSWREGLGIAAFEAFREATGATQLSLSANFRSYSEIVSAADRVVSLNSARIPKALVANQGTGGVVELELVKTSQAVTDAAVGFAVARPQSAVLARNNDQLIDIARQLKALSIPFHSLGGNLLDTAELQLVLSLLRAIETRQNLLRSNWIELLHWCGATAPTLSQFEGVYSLDRIGCLSNPVSRAIRRVSDFVEEASARDHSDPIQTVVELDLNLKSLIEICAAARCEGIALPASQGNKRKLALESAVRFVTAIRGTLRDRIEFIGGAMRGNQDEAQEGVAVGTIHGSKGLEWPEVLLVGVEEGSLPSAESVNHAEERRVLFVGITRAKSHVRLLARTGKLSQFLHAAFPSTQFFGEGVHVLQ